MSPDSAQAFGIALMALWGTAGAVAMGCAIAKSSAMRDLLAAVRKMSLAAKCALAAGLVCAVAIGGTKPGGTNDPPGGLRSSPATVSVEPSFAPVEVRTNAVALRMESTTSVEVPDWRKHGSSSGGVWLDFDEPFFLIGTNPVSRAHVAASGSISFESMRRPPVGALLPDGSGRPALAPLLAPLGMVPEANWTNAGASSRFWHDAAPGHGRVFTWEDALLDRQPGRRVSVQAELHPSGDFTCRYDFRDALDLPATNLVLGAQTGTNGVNALAILGTNVLSAPVWRVDGTTATNGIHIADFLCTNGVLRTPARFAIKWKNTTGVAPNADTDGDGLSDWDEVFRHGTDPNQADTDGDGLSDASEILAGTNPLDADANGDGVPDGLSAETWAGSSLWATNAPDGTVPIVVTLNDAVPVAETAALVIDSLCIPLHAPASWTIGLVPGESYPYRLTVAGDDPVNLSIGPGGGSTPPLRGGIDELSIALLVEGMGGAFDGCSLGGSGSMAIPMLNVQWRDPGDGSHEVAMGEVCLHGGSEAEFTPLLRPAGIHDQWLLSGLEERNGVLVLSVPSDGEVFSGAADLFTNKIRFGVVRALVSGHRCDATVSQPYCSVCGCYQPLDLALSARPTLTLRHDNQTTISIVHAHSSGESHSNGVVEIRRKEEYEWLPLGPESGLDPWTARIAGTFELRGLATVDGRTWATPVREIEVRFPSYSDIIGDETVSNAMEAAWQKTKDDCTEVPNLRHEVGFWIQLDTIADRYVVGPLAEGPYMGPSTNGSMHLPPRPRDSPHGPDANEPGALYTVGYFHTHTPRTYIAPTNQFRWVGPSEHDYTHNPSRYVAGIVYDYVGIPNPDGNPTNCLYNGHSKDAPARLYPIPPERRPTP